SRFPKLDGVGAIGQRVADEARRSGVDHLYFRRIHPELLREEFEHYEIRRRTGGRELLPLEIFNRLDFGPRGDDGPPEIEKVEKVLHLDAAGVRKTNREHSGTAADLELTRVELRRVGIGRTLDKLDIEPMRRIELQRLDHRRHK